MRLAEELQLPLVLVIDTLGASLSKEAEERGLAPEIARCISDLVTLSTPTVSVLLGQGTGGGAFALLPADRVLCAQHGWLAPLPPEGASAIVHRDTTHAPRMAEAQGIRARDLLRDGIVDGVIPERPDAAEEPVEFVKRSRGGRRARTRRTCRRTRGRAVQPTNRPVSPIGSSGRVSSPGRGRREVGVPGLGHGQANDAAPHRHHPGAQHFHDRVDVDRWLRRQC